MLCMCRSRFTTILSAVISLSTCTVLSGEKGKAKINELLILSNNCDSAPFLAVTPQMLPTDLSPFLTCLGSTNSII